MNIKEAKQEVIRTVQSYLSKDETGNCRIPIEKQRPILLMGPPGIGKTAIMDQVAKECGINLVSYTITHHTRQSAIGLPYISKKNYAGKEYSVTEYTMSEIVASIYDQIERSGVKEGILFLDEINCVSETLAPTMLQFLQYKTFGTHRVPDGFLIVTAGNPPQYNKSVRDFDIVTLDRVKKIDIEEDYTVWKEYAYRAGIHGSIMAYLEIRKDDFYSIHTDIDGKKFVTARGWEDLSRIIETYEVLGIPVTRNLIIQYIQDPEIAAGFSTYYELYNKYKNVYRIPEIMEGTYSNAGESLRNAPFDEKLSLIGLLIDRLGQEFRAYAENKDVQQKLFGYMRLIRASLRSGGAAAPEAVTEQETLARHELEAGLEANMISREDEKTLRAANAALAELKQKVALEQNGEAQHDFGIIQTWFSAREQKRAEDIRTTGDHLTNAFRFLSETFGDGQEMVIFLSELADNYYSLKFVSECGNEAYYKYNRLLLLKDRRETLREQVMELMDL